jgi:menaquinone-dependent protoporphyrinogen oxidase
MKKVLVTYASLAGSTADVARAVGDELTAQGVLVDVLPLTQVTSLEPYGAVVVGGPMIMGWHRATTRFLQTHRAEWQRIPVAVFVTAMTLTKTAEARIGTVPLYVDENLAKAPAKADRLTWRESYALPANYVKPVIGSVKPARPVSIGVFGGRLEYARLPWWAAAFALLVVKAPAGDRRNWPAIRTWASGLVVALGVEETRAIGR